MNGEGASVSGRFAGKVVLITGAARGQGRSHAVRFAREGAAVIAVDICAQMDSVRYAMAGPDDLAETVRQVEAEGGKILASEVDVRDAVSLAGAIADGVEVFGRLDVVSANAGIFSIGQTEQLAEQSWQDVIDVNLTGVWHTVKAAVPHLVAGGRGGSIVLTSSVAGLRGPANVAHYASAKHGLVGLMRTAAFELGPHGIRVNSLHPTQVGTDMILNEDTYRLFRPDLDHPDADDIREVSQQMHVLPVPWIESEDISNALLFLASDEARYITGVALPVDAGALLK